MIDRCPMCGERLKAMREVVYDDVKLDDRGMLVSARELTNGWRVTCAGGHKFGMRPAAAARFSLGGAIP